MLKHSSLLLLVAAVGCNAGTGRPTAPGAKGAKGAGVSAGDPKAPVARIGTEVITAAELDVVTKGQLTKHEGEHAERVHQTKTQALDGLLEKRLVEARAKKEGITSEQLIQREVTAKIPEPPESEVQMIYERTKASGRPLPEFAQVKGDIVKFVKQQNEGTARKAFVDKLKAEAKVEVLLPPLMKPKIMVAADGPSKGDPKAPVTIVEFSDFQCPFCSKAEETLKKVMEEYKGKVRVVFRDYPLPFHAEAPKASEAAHCAGDQGKYWEMNERLFANQQALAVPQLKEHAKALSLDQGKFDKCLDSGDKGKLVESSKKAAEEAGVTGTPAFFINGTPLSGAQPLEEFKKIIDQELRGG